MIYKEMDWIPGEEFSKVSVLFMVEKIAVNCFGK